MGFFKNLFSKKKSDPNVESDILTDDTCLQEGGADTSANMECEVQDLSFEQEFDGSSEEGFCYQEKSSELAEEGDDPETKIDELEVVSVDLKKKMAEDLLLQQLAEFGIGEPQEPSTPEPDTQECCGESSFDYISVNDSSFFDNDASASIGDDPDNWNAIEDDDIPADPDSEIERLRVLLVGPELIKLDHLHQTVMNPGKHAKAVSQVVTEALLLRTSQDDKLNTVLRPTVETIFKSYVRREPDSLVNQIFPVIGPAIRRSISETFLSMLQSFNSTLEMSFSLKGLKWRLEAWRTKKSFSEIVLLNTLVYRVDQVFLIHSESSTPLLHIVNDGVEARDSEMVSGMLSAIQDFFRDSFSSAAKERLETIQTEGNSIYIKRSGQIHLACVVRGTPPASLPQELQKAADLIAVEFAEELERFNGSTEAFKKADRYLHDFLVAKYKEKPRKLPIYIRALPFALLLGILGFIGWLIHLDSMEKQRQQAVDLHYSQEAKNYNDILNQLEQQAGLVVTRVMPGRETPWEINCLKDSLAQDPREFLLSKGMDANRFILSVKPYISLDTDIVKTRLNKVIELPPTVNMVFDEQTGVIKFTGTAPLGWIIATKNKALGIDGIQSVDTSHLKDPRADELEELLTTINGTSIYFPTDKDEPAGEDAVKLNNAVDNLVKLEKLAAEMQISANLIIYGHTDSIGRAKYNYELSQKRAKTVAAMLYARGSSMPISTYGLGSDFAKKSEEGRAEEDQASRKIELRVHLTQAGFGYGLDGDSSAQALFK